MQPFQLTFTARKSQLLREALAEWGISKRTLSAVKFEGGQLLVNGCAQTVRHVLNCGDSVTVVFPLEERSPGLLAEEAMLTVVYEDEAVFIADKPAGKSTIPSRDHPAGTLANAVAAHFEKTGTPATIHVVTRLDRNTSGLVCIAKNRHIHHVLSQEQQNGQMKRQYEALVHGTPLRSEWAITAPIGRKSGSIIEREVRADGQHAHTEVTVLNRYPNYTHVGLQLGTGRTHQIRVHLSHAGYPLLGDDLYGGPTELIDRQALHCTRLTFIHPVSREPFVFSSPLPSDMKHLLQT
ncbi:RluA family pseudouridine synthase [Planococcus lenghuensis]|uniref:Pseudouridine synthase n=1 Tax=Planococcus lenghuensis TaxID=2213202 RepID=A0A1Q2L0B9_9BACL|nr:RluA family pseudouridine synthase [Planococcus lenghuensis]AQQ53900.1 RNA pseudouridine synthase [Planococcus lenghuensis]